MYSLMIINHKQKLSPIYWGYSAAVKAATLKPATLYFQNAKNKESKGRLWWHFYLINFARNYEKDRLNSDDYIAVEWVQPYHFSYYNAAFQISCVSHILYEIANGRKPIIKDPFGVWADFYAQPFDKENDFEKIETSTQKKCFYWPWFVPYNRTVTDIWKKLFKDFCVFNEDTQNYVSNECKSVLNTNKKTLGVICRGTEYVKMKPKKHPKQPSVEETIKHCEKWMKKYGYEAIYLATEEERILNAFNKAFPGKILTNNRQYYDNAMSTGDLSYISDVHFERENDNYFKGIEYLSSLYILTKCDGLIAGNCGATRIVLFMKDDQYSNLKVFDKGLY